jgi:hypothetical protein
MIRNVEPSPELMGDYFNVRVGHFECATEDRNRFDFSASTGCRGEGLSINERMCTKGKLKLAGLLD